MGFRQFIEKFNRVVLRLLKTDDRDDRAEQLARTGNRFLVIAQGNVDCALELTALTEILMPRYKRIMYNYSRMQDDSFIKELFNDISQTMFIKEIVLVAEVKTDNLKHAKAIAKKIKTVPVRVIEFPLLEEMSNEEVYAYYKKEIKG